MVKLGDKVAIIRGVSYDKQSQELHETNNVVLTADNITLECDQPTQLTYTLYNANGQALKQGTYHGGQQIIDLQKHAAGSYMLHVTSPDNSQMNIYKIIKAK